jgi:hypothetical protein
MISDHYTINGVQYHVHHNGDWSGTVIISWSEKPSLGNPPCLREVELPGKLFLAIHGAAITDKMEAAVEKMQCEFAAILQRYSAGDDSSEGSL